MLSKVFVYGTLKNGFRLHRYLGDGQFVGSAEVVDFTLFDSGSGYPIAVHSKSEIVTGEVYLVNDAILGVLDQLELPCGYIRREVKTSIGKAYMYYRDVNFVSMQCLGFKYIGGTWDKRGC